VPESETYREVATEPRTIGVVRLTLNANATRGSSEVDVNGATRCVAHAGNSTSSPTLGATTVSAASAPGGGSNTNCPPVMSAGTARYTVPLIDQPSWRCAM
jgi:hypothetical protein